MHPINDESFYINFLFSAHWQYQHNNLQTSKEGTETHLVTYHLNFCLQTPERFGVCFLFWFLVGWFVFKWEVQVSKKEIVHCRFPDELSLFHFKETTLLHADRRVHTTNCIQYTTTDHYRKKNLIHCNPHHYSVVIKIMCEGNCEYFDH